MTAILLTVLTARMLELSATLVSNYKSGQCPDRFQLSLQHDNHDSHYTSCEWWEHCL